MNFFYYEQHACVSLQSDSALDGLMPINGSLLCPIVVINIWEYFRAGIRKHAYPGLPTLALRWANRYSHCLYALMCACDVRIRLRYETTDSILLSLPHMMALLTITGLFDQLSLQQPSLLCTAMWFDTFHSSFISHKVKNLGPND